MKSLRAARTTWLRIARWLVVALVIAVGFRVQTRSPQLERSQVAAMSRAHAHNDYEHARPLADALDREFSSVEADVWLVDGRLLVAHDEQALRPERTLESLYLDPLLDRVRRHGGRVYDDGPEFLLWIDVKSDAVATYAALRPRLARYGEMLTEYGTGGVTARAVRVMLSGNRARDVMAAEPSRYVALDGRLPDLEGRAPEALIPVISDNWQNVFQWRGVGPFPAEERARLTALVDLAHRQGRRIRFWAIPDVEDGWRVCLEAGVDFINTDRLDELRLFLTATR